MANRTTGECPAIVLRVTLGAEGRSFKSYRPDRSIGFDKAILDLLHCCTIICRGSMQGNVSGHPEKNVQRELAPYLTDCPILSPSLHVGLGNQFEGRHTNSAAWQMTVIF